jgi:hypothetical protein
MTDRAQLVLVDDDQRSRAMHWCRHLPAGTRVDFKGPLRSLKQNDRMWAMLTDVSSQTPWHGLKLSPDDWKILFIDALKRELRVVPNLDNTGFVNLSKSSSDLSKDEMSDLMTLITMFGDRNGVLWSDPKEIALREMERQAPRQIEHQR